MFGKYLLIALVCVSVAQVHGGVTEDAINGGLRRADGMNKNLKSKFYAAVSDLYEKMWIIESKTYHFVENARGVQESSRQSLRKIAAAVEEKAKQTNRPESVFQCISRNEENANKEIQGYTSKFKTDVERLYGTKRENMRIASLPYESMEVPMNLRYRKVVEDIKQCQNPRCVNTVLNSYGTYIESTVATIRRLQGQIDTILVNYQRDANNYYANANRQITRIRSTAIRNIKNCYFNGKRFFQDFFEDSQEF